jgi:microcystin-dependent protein
MADVTITDLDALAPSTNTYVPISNGTTTGKALYTGSSTPTGSIIMWPLNNPPENYLICDGSAVSRSTYSSLFAILGTAYGTGNGSTTFNLPDYRGQFLRGWANTSSTDPNRATRTNRGDGTIGDNVGTKQGYEIQSHNHNYSTLARTYPAPLGDYFPAWYSSTSVSTANTGGSETRPTNIYINYCIKT